MADFQIDRPEIEDGLHKARVVLYNPNGRWNTETAVGKTVYIDLGWGSSLTRLIKGKVYDRKDKDRDTVEVFIGQLGWTELLFQTETQIILDIEVSDIIKNYILSGTSVGTTNIEFGSGAEYTITGFHSDIFPSDDTIEETSDVTWVDDSTYDPDDYDAWTEDIEEENLSDCGTEGDAWIQAWTGNLTDDTETVQVGSKSKKFTSTSDTLNAAWRHQLDVSERFKWKYFKKLKIWIYREDSEVTDHFYIRLSQTSDMDQMESEVKQFDLDISDQTVDTWQEHTLNRENWTGIYEDILDNEEVRYVWFCMSKSLAIGKTIYLDGMDFVTEKWDSDSEIVLSKDTGVKQQGIASIKETHRKVYFEDDFNEETVDTIPDNWTVDSPGGQYQIKVMDYWTSRISFGDIGIHEGNRSVNFYNNSTTNSVSMYKQLGSGVTGSGIIQFVMSMDRTSGHDGWLTFYVNNDADANEIGFRAKHDYTNNETDMEYKDSGGWHSLTSLSGHLPFLVEITYDESSATYGLEIHYKNNSQSVSGKSFINNGTGLKKVLFDTDDADKCKAMMDVFFWGTVSGGSDTDREIYYHATQDELWNCETRKKLTFHIRQDTNANDPVLRLYSSDGNYFYRTVNISSADTFEEFEFELGSDSSGWSETGTPDWEGINWIAFFWSSSQTTVTVSYIDKLYFTVAGDTYWRLKTSSPDFTDDTDVEWDDGTYNHMISSNDKLEMASVSYRCTTDENGKDMIGWNDAVKFKATGSFLHYISVKVEYNGTGWEWKFGESVNDDSMGSGSGTPSTGWWNIYINKEVTVDNWYYLTLNNSGSKELRCKTSNCHDNLILIENGGTSSWDPNAKIFFKYQSGDYISEVRDGGASNVWISMGINSSLDGATIKLYTYSNDTGTLGTPSWTLRRTLSGGTENDIDLTGEDGRYLWYKIVVEENATVSTWVDDIKGYKSSYTTSGYIITHKLLTDDFEYFDDIKIDFSSNEPANTDVVAKASNDDGTTYETCTDNTWKQFTDHHSSADNHGRILKIKIEFSGNGSVTPKLYSIDVDVKVKPIVILEKFEKNKETRLRTIQKLADINNSDCYIDITPDCHFFPQTTKSSGQTVSRSRGLWDFEDDEDLHQLLNKVYLHGALDSTYPLKSDDLCEGDAASWTGTGVSVSDDEDYYNIGEESIRGDISPSSGFSDDCNDDSLSSTYFDQKKTGSATITEANGYIRCYSSSHPSNVAFIYYEDSAYELSGDFEILFDIRTSDSLLESPICAFVTSVPIYDKVNTLNQTIDYIKFDAPKKIVLRVPDGSGDYTQTTLKSNVNKNTWYNFKVKRSSTTHTIYINGEQVWSGTLYDSDHTNIQFGDFRTDEGEESINIDYDNFVYKTTHSGGNLLSPSLDHKNLDLFDSLKLWYSQNALDPMSIRLETDASNYYSWTVTPTKINEFFQIEIPVGSLSAGWSATGSPSWTDIEQVRFVFGSGIMTTQCNIDELHLNAKEIVVYSQSDDAEWGVAAFGEKSIRLYDRGIESREYASEIVRAMRERFDEPVQVISFKVLLNTSINPGESITVEVPDRDISDTYYVKNLSYDKGIKIKVTCNDNEYNLEHLLLGFKTQEDISGAGDVLIRAPEVRVD